MSDILCYVQCPISPADFRALLEGLSDDFEVGIDDAENIVIRKVG